MPNTSRRTIRITGLLLLVAAFSAGIAGCERTGREDQEKVNSAQRELEKKASEAQRESTTKVTSAQAEVDQKVAEANTSFTKNREEFRSTMTSKLQDAQKKVEKLESKSRTASGKTKAEIDVALPDIRTKYETLRQNMTKLDTVSMANWDATKNQLDNDVSALKTALEKAPTIM